MAIAGQDAQSYHNSVDFVFWALTVADLVKCLNPCSHRYLKGWFAIDFFSCLPVDIVLRVIKGEFICSFTNTCMMTTGNSPGQVPVLKLLVQ